MNRVPAVQAENSSIAAENDENNQKKAIVNKKQCQVELFQGGLYNFMCFPVYCVDNNR